MSNILDFKSKYWYSIVSIELTSKKNELHQTYENHTYSLDIVVCKDTESWRMNHRKTV